MNPRTDHFQITVLFILGNKRQTLKIKKKTKIKRKNKNKIHFGEVDWLLLDTQTVCSEDSLNSNGPFTWLNSLATSQFANTGPR